MHHYCYFNDIDVLQLILLSTKNAAVIQFIALDDVIFSDAASFSYDAS